MSAKKSGMKTGEKILFGIFGVFVVMAVIGFIAMEVVRAHSEKPMYVTTSHFDFSPEGLHGSELFRTAGCTACHRAVRNGTNMGLDLDGVGSRRSLQYLNSFLKNPQDTYGTATVDHGPAPKEAAYVSALPEQDLHAIAVFLSELRADRGSGNARQPPSERSGFIDNMLRMWAPEGWKTEFHDVREQPKSGAKEGENGTRAN
jgi:cytochrome c553